MHQHLVKWRSVEKLGWMAAEQLMYMEWHLAECHSETHHWAEWHSKINNHQNYIHKNDILENDSRKSGPHHNNSRQNDKEQSDNQQNDDTGEWRSTLPKTVWFICRNHGCHSAECHPVEFLFLQMPVYPVFVLANAVLLSACSYRCHSAEYLFLQMPLCQVPFCWMLRCHKMILKMVFTR